MFAAFRAASLLLAALLLSSAGCLHLEQVTGPAETETTAAPEQDPSPETDPPEAEPEPAAPATDPEAEPFLPDKDVLSEALALALTGWGTDYLNDPNGLWSVIGYYAALSARLEAPDAVPWLSDSACETLCTVLQSVLRSGEDPLPRPDWLGKEGAAAETRDGADGWRFDDYARMLDETLGVWRALDLTVESGTRIVTVEDHLDDGVRSCLLYAAFENPPDAGENDPEPLVYLVLTDFITAEAPENGGEELVSLLTRENLAAANGVEKLLFTYGGFHITETTAIDGADDLISDSWYLVDDPGILSVTEGHALNADKTPYTYTNYSFWDGENILYASVGGEGISASFFVGEDTPAGTYPGDDQFFYEFYDAPAELLASDAETVTFRHQDVSAAKQAAKPLVTLTDDENRSDVVEVNTSTDSEGDASGTTLTYSLGSDGLKWASFNDSLPEVYLLTNSGLPLSLAAKAPVGVPMAMGYRAAKDGVLTVSLPDADTFNGQSVWLTDQQTGTVTDLTTGTYELQAAKGYTDNRLLLQIGGVRPDEKNNNSDNKPLSWSVRSNSGTLIVVGIQAGDDVIIRTLSGAVEERGKASGDSYTSRTLPQGVYIVTVNGRGKKVQR